MEAVSGSTISTRQPDSNVATGTIRNSTATSAGIESTPISNLDGSAESANPTRTEDSSTSPTQQAGRSSAESNPTVIVFTTTLPSDLPAQLSSISISRSTQAQTSITSPNEDVQTTLTGRAQESHSVAGVLTSAGVPESVATSLAPVIVGSPPEPVATAPSSHDDLEEMKRRAAIEAILQWILNVLHLDQT